MDRHSDIESHLTLDSEEKQIEIQARGGKMEIHFRRMSIGYIFRQLALLDRLHLLNMMRDLSEVGGQRMYLKYGFVRFRMPGPSLMQSLVWIGNTFFEPG